MDKVVRFFFILMIAALYFVGIFSDTMAIVFGVIALYLLLTSFVGTCPIYLPFGWNTVEKPVESGRNRRRRRR